MPDQAAPPRPPHLPADGLPDRVAMPLLDLITRQSLDEDYRVAAEARTARRQAALEESGGALPPGSGEGAWGSRSRRRRTLAVAASVGVFGILISTAAVQTARNADVNDTSRASLIERANDRRRAVATLQDRIVRLRDGNAALGDVGQSLSAELSTTTTRVRRLEVVSGYVRTSGEGVRIVVSNAPQAVEDAQVRDTDLALLVNGLWEAGAEAVAINGQRLTALSAIRNSSTTIRVNRVSLSAPYTVVAIGDTRTLQADLADSVSGQLFRDRELRWGFGVSMDNVASLTVPAATLPVLEYAQERSAAGPKREAQQEEVGP